MSDERTKMRDTLTWWDYVEHERTVPRSSQEQERVIPARYHRVGQYHTNNPRIPMWKQVLESLKSAAPPEIMKCGDAWNVEDIVITDPELAKRVMLLFIKHRGDGSCLRHHLRRATGLQV